MATILLTDEEYTFVKQLKEEMQKRIPHSSLRAATPFTTIATHGLNIPEYWRQYVESRRVSGSLV